MCDDECPECGARDATPIDSHDLTNLIIEENGDHLVLRSPDSAEHFPEYNEVARFTSQQLAEEYIGNLSR